MSRTNPLKYLTVLEICNEFVRSGEKPSLRKIRERVGGSLSTILPFYQRWQEEQILVNKAEEDLSETFRQAVLAEFGRITLKTSQQLMKQINIKNEELNEIEKLLLENEGQIDQLADALALQQQERGQEQLGFEKKLSALQALIEAGEKRETALQNQIETLRQNLHQAELKIAVAEALYQKNRNPNIRSSPSTN